MSSLASLNPGLRNVVGYLTLQRDKTRTNVSAKNFPTPSQFALYVSSVSSETSKMLTGAPARIAEIVTKGFASFSWNLTYNRLESGSKSLGSSSSSSPRLLLSPASFVSGLDALVSELSNWSPPLEPSASELACLSLAAAKLWDLDHNRLVPDVDYTISLQSGKSMYDNYDAAEEPLFVNVQAEALSKPTFKAFLALLDNYVSQVGTSETVTPEEREENHNFLTLCYDSACVKYAHRWLLVNGRTRASDPKAFVLELERLWFGLYRRKVENDSSGFEHVFLGEIRDGQVTGFHNWLHLYQQEKKGLFDYRGFLKPRRRPLSTPHKSKPASHLQLVTLSFTWDGAPKPASSSFIGVSPEFEIALYSLIFLGSDKDKTRVTCGDYKVDVTAYKQICGGRQYIGTAFPAEAPLDEDEAASKIQNQFKKKSFAAKK